jgi:transposase
MKILYLATMQISDIVIPLETSLVIWYILFMAYDKKYRTRVIEYILEGHTHEEASRVFKVGTTSITRWLASYESSGSTGGGYSIGKRNSKKIDPDRLCNYMNEHPDAFLREIASEFSCCNEAVRKALLRNKYTLKKRRNISKNATKKHEKSLSKP